MLCITLANSDLYTSYQKRKTGKTGYTQKKENVYKINKTVHRQTNQTKGMFLKCE